MSVVKESATFIEFRRNGMFIVFTFNNISFLRNSRNHDQLLLNIPSLRDLGTTYQSKNKRQPINARGAVTKRAYEGQSRFQTAPTIGAHTRALPCVSS